MSITLELQEPTGHCANLHTNLHIQVSLLTAITAANPLHLLEFQPSFSQMLWEGKHIGLASFRGQEKPLVNGRWLSGLVKTTLGVGGREWSDPNAQIPDAAVQEQPSWTFRSRITTAGCKLKELLEVLTLHCSTKT